MTRSESSLPLGLVAVASSAVVGGVGTEGLFRLPDCEKAFVTSTVRLNDASTPNRFRCRMSGILNVLKPNLPQNVSLEASRSLRVAGDNRQVAPNFLTETVLFR